MSKMDELTHSKISVLFTNEKVNHRRKSAKVSVMSGEHDKGRTRLLFLVMSFLASFDF